MAFAECYTRRNVPAFEPHPPKLSFFFSPDLFIKKLQVAAAKEVKKKRKEEENNV